MQQEQQPQRHRQQPQQRNLECCSAERPPADEHNFSGRVTFAARVAQFLTVGGDTYVPAALYAKWSPPPQGQET